MDAGTKEADVIYTDVWVSMGEPEEVWEERITKVIKYYTAPSVAAITAFIVCIRFSASSNTSDWADPNTSSVTSNSVKPYFSPCSFPIFVFKS